MIRDLSTMQAWASLGEGDLRQAATAVPAVTARSVLVRVEACGVCRTDLHVIDGELPRHRDNIVPGHQIVGKVVDLGAETTRFVHGDRVGVAWLASTCGSCNWCRTGRENLCPSATFTGWDVDGGYAELCLVDERYAYAIPQDVDPVELAPLLCAGIIGFRALSRAALPPGGTLGIYGFGSSAYLTARIAAAGGARVHVMTRGEQNQNLARSLDLGFVGHETAESPEALDSAIIFAPAGHLVLAALAATAAGGTVVLAGIHMSDVPRMTYADHLFRERDLRSVTANTRADGEAFLRVANRLGLRAAVNRYRLDQTAKAVEDLRSGRAAGSLVIDMSGDHAHTGLRAPTVIDMDDQRP
ncbi:zinc-binding alcohol dehydrogenase family protein [Microbacterium sp. E-13]|uniref:zinc-binding alcohol dehydrogenase family protein n=1 Tax=Microbacterium sp. E-13 TaxID=3404048 RepID=UPI003CEED203